MCSKMIKPIYHTSFTKLPINFEFQLEQQRITDLVKSNILIVQSSKSDNVEFKTIDFRTAVQADTDSPPFLSANDIILLINF